MCIYINAYISVYVYTFILYAYYVPKAAVLYNNVFCIHIGFSVEALATKRADIRGMQGIVCRDGWLLRPVTLKLSNDRKIIYIVGSRQILTYASMFVNFSSIV